MNIKETKKLSAQVRERLSNGDDRHTIYNELRDKHNASTLARTIGEVPDKEDIDALSGTSNLLRVLFYVWASIEITWKILGLAVLAQETPYFFIAIPFSLTSPGLALWLAWRIMKCDRSGYLISAILAFVAFTYTTKALMDVAGAIDVVFSALLVVQITIEILTVVASYRVLKRYFPHMGFAVVKEHEGIYILSRREFEKLHKK